ncbi:MAG: FixH family protein [Polyangiaceae bacterium]
MNGHRWLACAIRPLLPLLLGAAALAACSDGETGTSGTTTATTTDTSGCATDTRAQVYAVGLSESSADGAVKITFVDADPAPPAKGNNTWTVKLTDGSGAALAGATIEATAYMPDHGHTSPIKPTGTEKDPGTYELTPVNLFMPGIWEVTLKVTPAGGMAEEVKFTFCVAG